MTDKVKPIPEGHHTVTPYLILNGAAAAIDFYKRAFGAQDLGRFEHEGKIGHAELKFGDSIIMLADEFPEMGVRGPQSFGGSPMFLHLYVEDVDALYAQAIAAGAKAQKPVEDKFYGDRSGSVEDPFGYTWYLSTHKEDLTMEEISKRAAAAMPSAGAA
jgi:PhnB protein